MLDRLRRLAQELPRSWKRLMLMAFDAVAIVLVLWLSYSLRLGTHFTPSNKQLFLMTLAPIVALPIFYRMGLYRAVIRHLPERAVWTIFQAMSLATLLWLAILFFAEVTRFGELPRSIPVFYWLLGTVVIVGGRFAAKQFLNRPIRKRGGKNAVVIYGAGAAGAQLAGALRLHGTNTVVGFIDEKESLQGRDVAGIRVYPPQALEGLIEEFGVQEVLLSLPSASATRRKEILAELSKHPVKIRALPAIDDLVAGKYLVSQLREIDIDDLLGRSSVPADPALLRQMLEHKIILVSGAGGSIGSELTRLIVKWRPAKLILLEANEFALYQIDRALAATASVPIIPVLGSVADEMLVRRTLGEHGVQVVFHAAAHKHVPLVEINALEGVRNNVFGTEVIARAAYEMGVEHFVLISTDKAVRPTNVMGATKRWAELIVSHYGAKALEASGARFCIVRFGNVLGSNGSVVPLFKEQIANGGPVTLTDERMTRYFMSIHEAAELIVQAGALSRGRDVFLLDMGEPIQIRELAENMIRLAGLTVRSDSNPEGDIAISVVGRRPGEKLYEELFYDPASAQRTEHPKVLRGTGGDRSRGEVEEILAKLSEALGRQDEGDMRRILFAYIEN
jgi:Predicted nucleoside-diphosphate sugar epimerases